MRLDRFLANMGCGSRSEVKKAIKGGRVSLNGLTTGDPGAQLDPAADQVVFNGESVIYQKYIYLMLNKPAGVISATTAARTKTVLDLIDTRYQNKGLYPVGRLDKDTEGLLILTNDGELGHQLLTPKKHVYKKYYAKMNGEVTPTDQEAFADGVLLENHYRTLPAKLEIIVAGPVSEVFVWIREGKFHQIKKMFRISGKTVIYLKRLAMGNLTLDASLGPGEYRELAAAEIDLLKESNEKS